MTARMVQAIISFALSCAARRRAISFRASTSSRRSAAASASAGLGPGSASPAEAGVGRATSAEAEASPGAAGASSAPSARARRARRAARSARARFGGRAGVDGEAAEAAGAEAFAGGLAERGRLPEPLAIAGGCVDGAGFGGGGTGWACSSADSFCEHQLTATVFPAPSAALPDSS